MSGSKRKSCGAQYDTRAARGDKRAKVVCDAAESGLDGPSPWQQPEHPILDRIIEQLLNMEDGRRWVSAAAGGACFAGAAFLCCRCHCASG